MSLKPRRGKSNYIQPRGGQYCYRRDIPKAFREFFSKTAWFIRLEGKTKAAREAEAGAIAHCHNKQLTINVETVASVTQNPLDGTLSLRLDFSPENTPVNKRIPPFEFYRDGRMIKTYKIAGSTDPDFVRDAERD